jgi:COP9 signalosome complex subunit 8
MATAVVDSGSDFTKVVQDLENQELESPNCVATHQVYEQLLAYYLLQRDLTNAKFLWKRIPMTLKNVNPDLALVWGVGQKMWQRDFPGIYESLKKEWPEHLKPIMDHLCESTRKRAFELVSHAYSWISASEFAAIMGMSVNESIEAAKTRGWGYDATTQMLTPSKLEEPPEAVITSEQHLRCLTEYVSFLEN